MNRKRFISVFVWLLITALCIFLTLNRHSRSGILNYHSEIWGDKAGYYIYLPLTFIYHFDAASLPDSIDTKTGGGYIVDIKNNIVKTKYPYGVALLQASFFLVAHWLATPLGYTDNGFTMPYNRAVDFAGVFYLVLGLFFLWNFLKKRNSKILSFFALFLLITMTNLYYYAIDETGMSHIYSFALFSATIWLVDIFNIKKASHVFLLSLLFALVFVVRPVNIIFIFFLLLLEKEKVKIWITELRQVKIVSTTAALVPAILVVFIQLFYWNYSSGNYVTNPYKGESFTFLTNPQLIKVWFSTNNGLFTYTPAWLFIMAGIIFMIVTKQPRGWIYLIFFLALSYMSASWWSWWLGCGFGHRAYVEYLPVFIMPAIFLWKKISHYKMLPFFVIFVFLIFAVYNFQLTYVWDGCWYGGTWDWQLLWQKLLTAF